VKKREGGEKKMILKFALLNKTKYSILLVSDDSIE
jgi:hypothetical protein